jgi:hypothetical protein
LQLLALLRVLLFQLLRLLRVLLLHLLLLLIAQLGSLLVFLLLLLSHLLVFLVLLVRQLLLLFLILLVGLRIAGVGSRLRLVRLQIARMCGTLRGPSSIRRSRWPRLAGTCCCACGPCRVRTRCSYMERPPPWLQPHPAP